ncbi:hypothetical protein D3C76_1785560 [compost metagenome]
MLYQFLPYEAGACARIWIKEKLPVMSQPAQDKQIHRLAKLGQYRAGYGAFRQFTSDPDIDVVQ